mmetsp:Transcript_23026/g.51888  ORF Transcript_23026/g.51888 Transcript_23026/m.51888 type:complete len:570 (-) Transcript_23026:147-1856(-)
MTAALCAQGDGYLALSVNVGLTAGFLAAGKRSRGGSVDLVELYRRFDCISSVSGGSWYWAAMLYSRTFAKLLEDIAAAPPAQAGQLFHKGFVNAEYHPVDETQKGCGSCCKSEVQKRWGSAFELMGDNSNYGVLLSTTLMNTSLTSFSWLQYVQNLLENTAGIDPKMPMGSIDVPDWGKKKVWLCNTSIVTPTDGATSPLLEGSIVYSTSPGDLPSTSPAGYVYVPAKFNIRIGAGITAPAPEPYMHAPSLSFDYTATLRPCGCFCAPGTKLYESSGPHKEGISAHFELGAGHLPVSSVTAASSAVIANNVAYPKTMLDKASLHPTMIPSVAPLDTPSEKAFVEAEALLVAISESGTVTEKSLGTLASKGVHWLADAFYTDNSGIANAIGSGASEIFAVTMNYSFGEREQELSSKSGGSKGFTSVPQGDSSVSSVPTIPTLSGLFEGGSPEGGPLPGGSVFVGSWDAAWKQKDSELWPLKLPVTDEDKYLLDIMFGTVTAMTSSNRWFGVKDQRRIKLNFVLVNSSLGVGANAADQWDNYERLMSAIVSAMQLPDNEETMQAVMKGMLF